MTDNGESSNLKAKIGILHHTAGESEKGKNILRDLFDKKELNAQHSLSLFEIYFDYCLIENNYLALTTLNNYVFLFW